MDSIKPQTGRLSASGARATTLALLIAAAILASPALAKMYKWVDEDGNVHYSDTVPPDQARQGREVKSDSGETVDKVDPPPSAEELERRRQEKAREEARRKREAERRERDQVLLMSYSSVKQIERTRDQRLDTLQSRINITRNRVEKLRKELTKERERAADAERSGRGEPGEIHRRIDQLEDQIAGNQAVIDKTEEEMRALREKFAAEIERYRELTKDDD